MNVPFGRTVTRVVRTAGGFDDKGNELPPTDTSSTFVATVQPVNQAERQVIRARGLSEAVAFVLYTTAAIRTSSDTAQVISDQVLYDGLTFDVVAVDPEDTSQAFPLAALKHNKAWLRRQDAT